MLTPAELAAHLRCSERTVARMVRDGCPSMLVGKRRRFDLAAVTRWIEAQAAACPSSHSRPERGTLLSASTASAFIDASRRVHLRVTPSSSKPTSGQPSAGASRLSLVTRD